MYVIILTKMKVPSITLKISNNYEQDQEINRREVATVFLEVNMAKLQVSLEQAHGEIERLRQEEIVVCQMKKQKAVCVVTHVSSSSMTPSYSKNKKSN
jgi:hypothetical protein